VLLAVIIAEPSHSVRWLLCNLHAKLRLEAIDGDRNFDVPGCGCVCASFLCNLIGIDNVLIDYGQECMNTLRRISHARGLDTETSGSSYPDMYRMVVSRKAMRVSVNS
jgi:hypothetical protein